MNYSSYAGSNKSTLVYTDTYKVLKKIKKSKLTTEIQENDNIFLAADLGSIFSSKNSLAFRLYINDNATEVFIPQGKIHNYLNELLEVENLSNKVFVEKYNQKNLVINRYVNYENIKQKILKIIKQQASVNIFEVEPLKDLKFLEFLSAELTVTSSSCRFNKIFIEYKNKAFFNYNEVTYTIDLDFRVYFDENEKFLKISNLNFYLDKN